MELTIARLSGRVVAGAALLYCLAAPSSAQVPLPKPRPPAQAAAPAVTGSVAAKPVRPPSNIVPVAQAEPNPVSNPFAALLGKPASNSSITPQQRAVIERVELRR